jgi:Flp pilus assembly protein TadG
MKATAISRVWRRTQLAVASLWHDRRGIAAVEFAVTVPVMLIMLFGTIEISSGVAVDRKVTLIARTLSDLVSQAAADPVQGMMDAPVTDTYLQNVFTAGIAILTPYCATPAHLLQVSEIYIDSNMVAKIQWSRAAAVSSCTATQAAFTTATHSAGDIVALPTQLAGTTSLKQTYLIFSEVKYLYAPVGISYVMKASVDLSDTAYARVRQAACVVYSNHPVLVAGVCPTPLSG